MRYQAALRPEKSESRSTPGNSTCLGAKILAEFRPRVQSWGTEYMILCLLPLCFLRRSAWEK